MGRILTRNPKIFLPGNPRSKQRGFIMLSGSRQHNEPPSGGGTGTVIYGTEYFTGFSTTTTTAQTRTQLVTNGEWEEVDDAGGGPTQIQPWPADASKKCIIIEYTVDQGTVRVKYLLPGSVTHLSVEWDEIRSTGFDFSYTKDVRFPAFRTNNGSDTIDVDLYSGVWRDVGTATGGTDDSTYSGMGIQGANYFPQTGTGDANLVQTGAFVMTRNVAYHVYYEIQLNTPGTANGSVLVRYVRSTDNQTTTIQRTNVKLVNDGVVACQFRRFQLGMDATSGGAGFVSTSKIYRTGFLIKSYP